jgi:hypothetical protein
VLVVAAADLASAFGTRALHLPFFADTWATSAAVLACGLGTGLAGGVLYDAIMAATVWGPRSFVWAASTVLVAYTTRVFHRAGWIDIERPFRLVAAGVLTGLANACLATMIIRFVLPEAVDESIEAFRTALAGALGDTAASVLAQEIVIEVADKTIAIITAAAVVVLLVERRPAATTCRAA